MSRWFFFLLTAAIGLAAGLYYGWFLQPVKYVDTTPETLRSDFKADFVLMVAEAYQTDQDLPLAMVRLSYLGDASPDASVQHALAHAVSVQPPYPSNDLALIQKLAEALQNRYKVLGQSPQETSQP
jgi:hypothetical protein